MFSKKGTEKVRNYKVRFRVMLGLFCFMTAALALTVYSNYDYFAFKILMATSYSYTDTIKSLYKDQLKQNEVSDNLFKDFDDAVIAVMTEKIRSINGDGYTYLYTPQEYVLQEETTKEIAKEAEIKEIDTDTVYLRIPNVSEYTRNFIYDNVKALKGYKNIIIDLCSNYGGSLDSLYEISDLLLEKGMIIGKEETRLFHTKTIKAKKKQELTFEKIVLLQNAHTASAAEGFINSLRENLDNVTVIGTVSFGKGIGQITLPLKRGYAVKATVLRVITPQGNNIHKIGIQPDIMCDGAEAFARAVEFLKEQRSE